MTFTQEYGSVLSVCVCVFELEWSAIVPMQTILRHSARNFIIIIIKWPSTFWHVFHVQRFFAFILIRNYWNVRTILYIHHQRSFSLNQIQTFTLLFRFFFCLLFQSWSYTFSSNFHSIKVLLSLNSLISFALFYAALPANLSISMQQYIPIFNFHSDSLSKFYAHTHPHQCIHSNTFDLVYF